MHPDAAIYIAWIAWYVSWVIAASWSSVAIKTPGARQWVYVIPEFGGFFILLVLPNLPPLRGVDSWLFAPLWMLSEQAKWAMVGVAAAGFAFCWWARIHLGVLWSGFVTRKQDHRVVDTGPYRIVRHPIYTGVITAALATMAIGGTPVAIAGAALLIIGYWAKGRFEEGFLRGELGAEAYDAYARKTAMLIPFVKL
jgi:protein-S-isoprenylcysteine O-methyltransferase Ste14